MTKKVTDMEIFSINPKPFNIRRKSPAASELKSSISAKLLDFIAEFTDDILAEYITVMVCNGKNQYQARDDLQAFLGERSGEFVSWLWGHLLNRPSECDVDISLRNPNEVSVTSPKSSDRDTDSRISRERCSDALAQSLLPRRNEISTEVEGSEKIVGGSFASDSSGKESNPVISANRDQGIRCMTKPKQIRDRKFGGLPNEHLYFPKNDPQSPVSGHHFSKQICVSNVLGRHITPIPAVTFSMHAEKPRVSVWDRLGKPSDDEPEEGKIVHLPTLGHNKQDEELHNQRALIGSWLSCRASRIDERSRVYDNLDKSENPKDGVCGACEPHAANNIGRKRLFGETSSGPGSDSVPSRDKRKMEPQINAISHELQKSDLATKDSETSLNLVSTMLGMKQRLEQIEMEMSKLRSKQVEKEKYGKLCQLSNPSRLKHPVEDIESRTIVVTNVHFAATKEALSLFFAKCGAIVNVVMLTDPVTAKPKGSAYITFACKESVDRAVALSGTTFISRTVKVLRKEEAGTASAPFRTGKSSKVPLPKCKMAAVPGKPYYSSSHLQWRRENTSGQSEPSASASVKGIPSSASQGPLPRFSEEENT
ncbi:Splicing factor-like protein [Parasponia andersonii]|uniref:Splicing factor-like protein n=1 Tax=Parasponia andersonii TaxID=3476 RepID=A0A2P5DKC3_PARAD|nr:Splicing factor-like protein [Parasponia andersonii]